MNDIKRAIESINNFIKVWELEQADEEMQMIICKKDIEAFKIAISALEEKLSGGWIPFKIEYDEDYKMGILQGKIPDDEQEILVSNGKSVWMDTFTIDGIECYLDSGTELISEAKEWMPKPEPYKEVENE